MEEAFTRDSDGNVVSRVVTATNENGNIVEQHFDKDDVLFEDVEKIYNDNNLLKKVIKKFPKKNTETIFEYEYDENNDYKRVIQRDVSMVENVTVHEYQNGNLQKTTREECAKVHLKKVVDHSKNENNVEIFCNDNPMYSFPWTFENCYTSRFDELVKSMSTDKIYTGTLLENNVLHLLAEAVLKEDWEFARNYAEDIIYLADEGLNDDKEANDEGVEEDVELPF